MRWKAPNVVAALLVSAMAFGGQWTNSVRGQEATRLFTPRVMGSNRGIVIAGRIVQLRGERLEIETAHGARMPFLVDQQTTVLASNELVSIATIDDVTLEISDLRPGDRVEVVAERSGPRSIARIITRLGEGKTNY